MHRIYDGQPNDVLSVYEPNRKEIYDEATACGKWVSIKTVMYRELYEVKILGKPSVRLMVLQILGTTLIDGKPIVFNVPDKILQVLKLLKATDKNNVFTVDTSNRTITVIKSTIRRKSTSTGINYREAINELKKIGSVEVLLPEGVKHGTVRASLRRVSQSPIATKLVGRTLYVTWR